MDSLISTARHIDLPRLAISAVGLINVLSKGNGNAEIVQVTNKSDRMFSEITSVSSSL